MMNLPASRFRDEFKAAFGFEPNADQVKVMDKFARHIRGRCTNNAKLVRYYRKCFDVEIKEIEVTDKDKPHRKIVIGTN